MNLSYDPRYNIAYLKLREKTLQVQTIKVSEEINVDLSLDGTIYGIELLDANRQLQNLAGGKLVIENEATGGRTEVVLP
jgi:uncharacterized protein YuzE